MKKPIIVGSLMALAICTAFTLAKQWNIDAQNSKVSWELPFHHKSGTFSNLKANIHFDKKNLAESKISASVDAKTIKVGSEKQEAHLISWG